MQLRKTRLEILQEEVEECHTVLESAYIERDIALIVGELGVLPDIDEQIKAMLSRLKALDKLLFKAEHPETITYNEDFIGWITINSKGGTRDG